jgi:high-affinity iron transporter
MVHYFNVAAFFITIREVLEVCLVIGIIIAYLNKTGTGHLVKWVWYGSAAGVALSSVTGIALSVVYYTKAVAKFAVTTEAWVEAVGFSIAVILMTWVILWMLKTGTDVRRKLENNLGQMIDQEPSKTKVGLFLLAFFQTLRQGIEVFIFLFGAQSSIAGDITVTDSWKGIIAPGLLGVIAALGISYFVFRGLLTLDLHYILTVSSLILVLFAAGLTSRAFNSLQAANALGEFEENNNLISDWWNCSMWSIKSCCDSKDNAFFATVNTLLGVSDSPSFVLVASYIGYWLAILPFLLSLYWQPICSARDRIARWTRGLTGTAFICFFVGFIYALSHPSWTGVVTTTLGLILSISASVGSFDMLSNIIPDVKSRRKAIVLATAVAFGLLTVFASVLQIAQMSCLDKSCRLPKFYYWGLILNRRWLDTADKRTATAFKAIAVLTLSTCITLVFVGGLSFALYLFAVNIGSDGNYIYGNVQRIADDATARREQE